MLCFSIKRMMVCIITDTFFGPLYASSIIIIPLRILYCCNKSTDTDESVHSAPKLDKISISMGMYEVAMKSILPDNVALKTCHTSVLTKLLDSTF